MDVIFIAGDEESVVCGFGHPGGNPEHAEFLTPPLPADLIERIAAGPVDRVVFCHPSVVTPPQDAAGST